MTETDAAIHKAQAHATRNTIITIVIPAEDIKATIIHHPTIHEEETNSIQITLFLNMIHLIIILQIMIHLTIIHPQAIETPAIREAEVLIIREAEALIIREA